MTSMAGMTSMRELCTISIKKFLAQGGALTELYNLSWHQPEAKCCIHCNYTCHEVCAQLAYCSMQWLHPLHIELTCGHLRMRMVF